MFSAYKPLACVLLCCGAWPLAAVPPLRVCADPNDLPYSNEQRQGFENKLAELIARDFGTEVLYTWYPQREKFFRNTLSAGVCDVVLSVPTGFDKANTTQPYYRSSYVFLSRHDRNLHIQSLDDPRLHHLRIGVHVLGESDSSLPPVHALINRGIVRNLVGYSVFGNQAEPHPQAQIVEAVTRGDIDIAVAWGPLAGYYARDSAVRLDVTPITRDQANPELPLTFDMAVGIRPGNEELKRKLDGELQRRAPEIQQLLRSFGVPQLSLAAPSLREQ